MTTVSERLDFLAEHVYTTLDEDRHESVRARILQLLDEVDPGVTERLYERLDLTDRSLGGLGVDDTTGGDGAVGTLGYPQEAPVGPLDSRDEDVHDASEARSEQGGES